MIDTGSFISLISKELLAGLKNIKMVGTSLREMVGIGNVKKPVLGAVLIERGRRKYLASKMFDH